jgi:hypothetical protein
MQTIVNKHGKVVSIQPSFSEAVTLGSGNVTFSSTPITSAPIYILHNYASTTAA